MVRCVDGSVYTGITKDVRRRMEEHKSRGKECAKYMRSHPFLRLEAVFEANSRSEAARLEYAIKHLSKEKKERLIAQPQLVCDIVSKTLPGCDFIPVVVE